MLRKNFQEEMTAIEQACINQIQLNKWIFQHKRKPAKLLTRIAGLLGKSTANKSRMNMMCGQIDCWLLLS